MFFPFPHCQVFTKLFAYFSIHGCWEFTDSAVMRDICLQSLAEETACTFYFIWPGEYFKLKFHYPHFLIMEMELCSIYSWLDT